MPPKTVVCSICKQEVTKRKTIMGPIGRICRCHPEAEKIREKENKKRHVVEDQKQSEKQRECPSGLPIERKDNCWICGREGVSQRFFLGRLLVNMSKYSDGNIFVTNETINRGMRLDFGDNPLVILTCDLSASYPDDVEFDIHPDFLAQFSLVGLPRGHMNACSDCRKKYNLNVARLVPDNLDPDVVLALGNSLRKHVIDPIATVERMLESRPDDN